MNTSSDTNSNAALPEAGLGKRLMALIYDALLLVAVLFLAMALLLLLMRGESLPAGNPLLSLYLLGVSYLFFGWFWTHGGQTLGMRAWRLRLQQQDGRNINWQQAAIRVFGALPGWIVMFIGLAHAAGISLESHSWLLWVNAVPRGLLLLAGILILVFDQRPGGWRDRLSATRMVQLDRDQPV